MSGKKSIHFKDEIRRSFIFYALIPALAFAVIVVAAAALIWNWRLYRHTADENQHVSSLLSQTVSRYRDYCEQFTEIPAVKESKDVSSVYAALKNFTLKQKIEADFVVLADDYTVLLQGSSSRFFSIPDWQFLYSWGALGRMKNNPQDVIIEISSDYNGSSIPEIVIGRSFSNGKKMHGYLIFLLSPELFKNTLNISLPFAITNSYGRFLYAADSRYVDQLHEIVPEYRKNKSYYRTENEAVFHSICSNSCFEVFTFSDISLMRTAFLLLIFMIITFLALVIIGLYISAEKISEEKSKTVDKIVAACESVSNGTFKGHLDVDSNIEFQTIAAAFNDMLDDVHSLIEENRRETKEKYNAELKGLEMQFNPHFLFNTLETIKFLVKLDPDKAQKTILCLSELLRYSISNESSVVPIREDIHYIENYLYILQLRFGSRFNYSIDIPESLYECIIPKLILQPLIGNSVKYGFEGIDVMSLSITARSVSGRLTVAVQDNGSGMDKEALKSIRSLLRSEKNETTHTGLHTAQRRIQLMYGMSYGVKIESSKEGGTRVKVTMPVIKA